MPQSLARVYVHIVFSTKNREPWIETRIRSSLHACVGSAVADLGCIPLCIGGVEDHVHVLCSLSRTRTIAELVEELKKRSSKWMKRQGIQDFWWQIGYAAFSIGHSQFARTVRYIERQVEHHREQGFQDELRGLLKRSELAYDERYLWD